MSSAKKLRRLLEEQAKKLKALEQRAPAEPGALSPLVLLMSRAGADGEARAPGLHYRDPTRRRGAELVFAGDEPPEELPPRFRAKGHRPGALVLIEGPAKIDPPADMP